MLCFLILGIALPSYANLDDYIDQLYKNISLIRREKSVDEQLLLRPALVTIGLVDLPISLVTDTLIIPYDIYQGKDR